MNTIKTRPTAFAAHLLAAACLVINTSAYADDKLANTKLAGNVGAILGNAGIVRNVPLVKTAEARNLPASQPFAQAAAVPPVTPNVKGLIIRFSSPEAKQLSRDNQPPPQALIDNMVRAAGVKLIFGRAMSMDSFVFNFEKPLSWSDAQLVMVRLTASALIEKVDPDLQHKRLLTPNDTYWSSQWNLQSPQDFPGSANLRPAWDITQGSSNTVVAVVDTGVRPHSDFFQRLLPGYDFVSDLFTANDGGGRDADAYDPGDWVSAGECGETTGSDSSWHGTHVAGTIAASGNNSTGIAGATWNSRILPVRVLGKCGGTVADIVDGMSWAAGLSVPGVPSNPNPAKVINMSLGGVNPNGCAKSAYQEAINLIKSRGVLIVVAAGNSNTEAASFVPASCDGVMTVGSVGPEGYRASYSNYSQQYKVDISAPGGDQRYGDEYGILSTVNTGTTVPALSDYGYKQGTSMAAPHVAGIAALALGLDAQIAPELLQLSLLLASRSFPASSTCTSEYPLCGLGIVDAAQTLAAVVALKPYSLVYEFYNVNLKHYFRTNNATEASIILSGGVGTGWIDTQDYFLVWRDTSQGAVPVCRFYSTGDNSHFFTANTAECETVKKNPNWKYEGIAYYVKLPVNGVCPADTTPIYRAYNNRWMYNDGNHRFSTDMSVINELVASKWVYEGVAMCGA